MVEVGRALNATLRKRKNLTHTWHHTRSFLFSSYNIQVEIVTIPILRMRKLRPKLA